MKMRIADAVPFVLHLYDSSVMGELALFCAMKGPFFMEQVALKLEEMADDEGDDRRAFLMEDCACYVRMISRTARPGVQSNPGV